MVSYVLQTQSLELSKNELSKDKIPYIIKNKLLLAPGEWNGMHYTLEEIEKAFGKTDWKDKDVISLIADHNDKPLSVHDWFGWVLNPRLDNGSLVADLELWDEEMVNKLVGAEAKFGVSAKVGGIADETTSTFKDFVFENFSIVSNPACKLAYLNLNQEELVDKEKNNQIEEKGGKEMAEEEEKTEEKEEDKTESELSVLISEIRKLNERLTKHLQEKEEAEKKLEVKEEVKADEELKAIKQELSEIKKKLNEPDVRTIEELSQKSNDGFMFDSPYSQGTKEMASYLQKNFLR